MSITILFFPIFFCIRKENSNHNCKKDPFLKTFTINFPLNVYSIQLEMLFKQLINPSSLRCSTRFIKPSILSRQYHSKDHKDVDEFSLTNPQTEILEKALAYVPKYGFQHKAILEASREVGYSDAIQSLFSHGTYDLIHYHLVKQRLNLQKYLQTEEFLKLNELGKLKFLVKKRLLANKPYVEHLSQLQSYLILPPYFKQSSEELHNLSDDIVFFAGDKSNDFAWYTKRLSLSSSYVAFELFMSNDKSEGFQNTLQLVDKRLDSIDGIGGFYNDLEEFINYGFHSGINLIKSQASRG